MPFTCRVVTLLNFPMGLLRGLFDFKLIKWFVSFVTLYELPFQYIVISYTCLTLLFNCWLYEYFSKNYYLLKKKGDIGCGRTD